MSYPSWKNSSSKYPSGNVGGLSRNREGIAAAVILGATLIAFFPSLFNGFVYWDDPGYTYENPLLKDFSFSEAFSFSTSVMGNYHPVTLLWLHWETLIFPKGNPALRLIQPAALPG